MVVYSAWFPSPMRLNCWGKRSLLDRLITKRNDYVLKQMKSKGGWSIKDVRPKCDFLDPPLVCQTSSVWETPPSPIPGRPDHGARKRLKRKIFYGHLNVRGWGWGREGVRHQYELRKAKKLRLWRPVCDWPPPPSPHPSLVEHIGLHPLPPLLTGRLWWLAPNLLSQIHFILW